MEHLELIYALVLFGAFFALWKGKQYLQKRSTGHDPEVFLRSQDPLQRFLFYFFVLLRVSGGALIVAHGVGLENVWGFQRLSVLENASYNHIGFGIGVVGLMICLIAQYTMGASWRVGIDQERPSELVIRGIFRMVRNPTYLGLLLLVAGLWIIWPTPASTAYFLLIFFFIEVLVRGEESYLEGLHGKKYLDYKSHTQRYLPLIY